MRNTWVLEVAEVGASKEVAEEFGVLEGGIDRRRKVARSKWPLRNAISEGDS